MRVINNPPAQVLKSSTGEAIKLPTGEPATMTLKATLLELVVSPAIAGEKKGMDAVFAAIDVRSELTRVDWDAESITLSEATYAALDAAIKTQQFNLQFAAELGVIFNAWRNATMVTPKTVTT